MISNDSNIAKKSLFDWNNVLIPIITSLTICLPYLIIFIVSDAQSPAIFQDWDEALYAALMNKVGSYRFSALLEQFPVTPLDFPYVPRFYAHSLVDLILGNLLKLSGINVLTLLSALDLICTALAFAAFERFFLIFTLDRRVASCAAIFAIAFPYLPSLAEGHFLLIHSAQISSTPLSIFPTLPSMRGIYTQLSIAPYILLLTSSVNILFAAKSSGSITKSFITGMCGGILIYIYAFAWIALISLIAVLCVLLVVKNFKLWPEIIRQTSALLFGSILVAMPGIVLNAGMRSAIGMDRGAGGPYPIWLPLDYIIILAVTFFTVGAGKKNHKAIWQLFVIATILAEITLGNLEALTQQMWTSYHFSYFYLRPLLAGFIAIPTVELMQRNFDKSARAILCLSILWIGTICYLKANSNHRGTFNDLTLFKELSVSLPSDAVVASRFFSAADGDSIPLVEPYMIESVNHFSVHFGESVFRTAFPKVKSGFNYLRTLLMNRGQQLTVCAQNEASVSQKTYLSPIFKWFATEGLKQCQQLEYQLSVLCRQSEWSWYPNFLLTDKIQLAHRSEFGGGENSVTALSNERYLLTLSAQREKEIICNRALGSK